MYFFCEDNPILIKNELRKEQRCYLNIMKEKKTGHNTNTPAIPQKKNEKATKISSGKDEDFGGIPDVDPNKFLGCG